MNDAFAQGWALAGLILFFVGVAVVKGRKAGPFLLWALIAAGYVVATVALVAGDGQ